MTTKRRLVDLQIRRAALIREMSYERPTQEQIERLERINDTINLIQTYGVAA